MRGSVFVQMVTGSEGDGLTHKDGMNATEMEKTVKSIINETAEIKQSELTEAHAAVHRADPRVKAKAGELTKGIKTGVRIVVLSACMRECDAAAVVVVIIGVRQADTLRAVMYSLGFKMFVRASLVRSWFAAPRLVRESGEVVKRLSSARVCAAKGKTAARRFEPLKEHPDFEVALDDYELPRSEPPESESDDEYEDGVLEEDDQKTEKLSAYQRFQRRHKRPKKPVKRVTQLTRKDIPLVPK